MPYNFGPPIVDTYGMISGIGDALQGGFANGMNVAGAMQRRRDEQAARQALGQYVDYAYGAQPNTLAALAAPQGFAPAPAPGAPPQPAPGTPNARVAGSFEQIAPLAGSDGLNPQFVSSLQAMIAGAPPEIRDAISISSGYRSPERQAQLYDQAVAKYGSPQAARKWVAPPGRSRHNYGQAADLKYGSDAARQWAHENAARYGLSFPMSWEDWHIEPAGARSGNAAGQQAIDRAAPGAALGFMASDMPATDAGYQEAQTLPPRDVVRALVNNPQTREFGLQILKDARSGFSGPQFVQKQQQDGSIWQIDRRTGEASVLVKPTGAADGESEYGLNPVYGTDANGNPVLIQLSKTGEPRQVTLPNGVALSTGVDKIDLGTQWGLIDKRSGQMVGTVAKDVAGEEAAKEQGKAAGKRAGDAPKVIQQAEAMLASIDDIINDPNRTLGTGLSSMANVVPGSPGYDFQQKVNQLQGQAFLQAFESLKGGGQITEIEGRKATEAIARLQTAQSEGAFLRAMQDLRSVVVTARERAMSVASDGGGAAPIGPGSTNIDDLVKKYGN